MRICALVPDLMDRSRIASSVPGAEFAASVQACAGADVVVVDLRRHHDDVADLRRTVPSARIVAFGPHIDDDVMRQARAAGADAVLPRSRFFRDVAQAVAPA